MTNQDKIREAERIIREACPETMKLSFGCEVKLVSKIGRNRIGRMMQFIGEPSFGWIRLCGDKDRQIGPLDHWKPSEYEVLGHPLQLHHVLRAIEKSGFDDINRTLIIRPNGKMEVVLTDDEIVELEATWDLAKPLSGQSLPTLSFLSQILNK